MRNKQPGSVARGLGAGLIATIVLSLVLLIKQALGLMPQVDLILALSRALGFETPLAGWIANFAVGVLLWGVAFAWLDRLWIFGHAINGLLFGSIVWLGVMLLIMPMAGAGFFGLRLSIVTPTLTLFLHWVYGVALGLAYGWEEHGGWERITHRLHHA